MVGGWLSFQGRHGQGGWRKTPLEEVLPVEMFDIFDDRVETPEGSRLKISQTQHPIAQGIPWDNCPLFLGYNRVKLKTGSILIGTIGEDDPAIATGEFKREIDGLHVRLRSAFGVKLRELEVLSTVLGSSHKMACRKNLRSSLRVSTGRWWSVTPKAAHDLQKRDS